MAQWSDNKFSDGRKRDIGIIFSRPAVFSAEECDAMIAWAEAENIAEKDRIRVSLDSLGEQPFIRSQQQIIVASGARKQAVVRFHRKLREWMRELNNQIWGFDITRFGKLWLFRYESGDQVGLHYDLRANEYDRKLSALVQLSPADAYSGGELGIGLPVVTANREQGSLLVFPIWVPHRVMPVTSGVRYAVGCDAIGPTFR